MNETSTGASMEMPRYQSHKRVWALQIRKLTNLGGHIRLEFVDERYAPIEIPGSEGNRIYRAVVDHHNSDTDAPLDTGYLVVYEDGYRSWSPSKAFEEGYERL